MLDKAVVKTYEQEHKAPFQSRKVHFKASNSRKVTDMQLAGAPTVNVISLFFFFFLTSAMTVESFQMRLYFEQALFISISNATLALYKWSYNNLFKQ